MKQIYQNTAAHIGSNALNSASAQAYKHAINYAFLSASTNVISYFGCGVFILFVATVLWPQQKDQIVSSITKASVYFSLAIMIFMFSYSIYKGTGMMRFDLTIILVLAPNLIGLMFGLHIADAAGEPAKITKDISCFMKKKLRSRLVKKYTPSPVNTMIADIILEYNEALIAMRFSAILCAFSLISALNPSSSVLNFAGNAAGCIMTIFIISFILSLIRDDLVGYAEYSVTNAIYHNDMIENQGHGRRRAASEDAIHDVRNGASSGA